MKLSKATKEEIVCDVIRKKVVPQEEQFAEREKAVVLELFNEKIKPFETAIASAPAGLLFFENRITVFYGKAYQERIFIELDEDRIVPYSWYDPSSDRIRFDVSEDEKWKKIFSDLGKEKSELQKYRENLKRELNGFLGGVSTDNQLFEALPEIAEHIDISKHMIHPVIVKPDNLKKLLSM